MNIRYQRIALPDTYGTSNGDLGFSEAEMPFPGPFPINNVNIDVPHSKVGKLEGRFTSATEASGTIDLIIEMTLFGSLHTCDFGE